MPIEVNCANCAALLRVADEHAGKKAKCPNCESINNIPMASTAIGNEALPMAAAASPYSSPPGAGQQANPYAGNQYPPPQQYQEAERGGIVFALGIIGLLVCQIPGIFAYFMGKSDLAKMKAGIMDPSGEGLTQAGMIMGLISMIFLAIGLLFVVGYVILIVVVVAGSAAGGM